MRHGRSPAARRFRGCAAALAMLAMLGLGACRSGFDRYAPSVPHPAVATLFAVRGEARRLIGTGFLVGPDALVTAHHVARAAAFDGPPEGPSARIDAVFPDGVHLEVVGVRGGDPDGDLIVLAVGSPSGARLTEGTRPLPIRDTPVEIGERVVTVGSPRGRAQTVGVGRVITTALTGDGEWGDRFPVSVPSAGGASGGPVLDAKGLVVGVGTRGAEGPPGWTMASPATRVIPLVDRETVAWETWSTSAVLFTPERVRKRIDQANISGAENERASLLRALGLYVQAASVANREKWLFDAEDGACDCLVRLGHPSRAIDRLRACVARRPTCAWAETLLGTYLARTGEPEEGQRHLERARRLDPRDARAALRAGEALFRHNLPTNALPALRKAVELAPSWAYAWELLGSAAGLARRIDEGAAAYRRVVELRPDYAMGYAAYARLLLILGKGEEAGDAAESAVRLDAASLTAHEVLASVRYTAGDEEGARLEIETVRRLDADRAKLLDAWFVRRPPR